MRISLTILCCVFILRAAGGSLSRNDAKDLLWDLGSSNEDTRKRAARELLDAGDEAVDYIAKYHDRLTTRQTLNVIPVLGQMSGSKAELVLAEFSLRGAGKKIRTAAAAELKKKEKLSAKTTNLYLTQAANTASAYQDRAVSTMGQINEPFFVDAILDNVDEKGKLVQGGVVSLDLHIVHSQFLGYEDHPAGKTVIRGNSGRPIVIENNYKTPVFRRFEVRTKVQIPIMMRVLSRLTGKDFGADVHKWREWRKAQREETQAEE